MPGFGGLEILSRKLSERHVWERMLRERLAEPLHLNLLAIPVALFGSLRAKIYFDLVLRQQHAFSLLHAADKAKSAGIDSLTAVEFGVANGAGLMNICEIARRVHAETGVRFQVLGFDTGKGMPPAKSYRDHPEYYQGGDFPMQDRSGLQSRLPEFASLIIGDLAETVPAARERMTRACPLGFASIDVDYYSSTIDCLEIFQGAPEHYLPMVDVYVDDVQLEGHNQWCGELLAFSEFNDANSSRKLSPHRFMRENRLFQRATWLSHMHTLHVLDHPGRSPETTVATTRVLGNAYMGLARTGIND
jgi:hypothetical protein